MVPVPEACNVGRMPTGTVMLVTAGRLTAAPPLTRKLALRILARLAKFAVPPLMVTVPPVKAVHWLVANVPVPSRSRLTLPVAVNAVSKRVPPFVASRNAGNCTSPPTKLVNAWTSNWLPAPSLL